MRHRRLSIGAEDLGRPNAFQKKGNLEGVFQIYGQVVGNIQGSRARFPGEMTQIIRQPLQQDTVFRRRDPCDRTAQSAQERCRADNVPSSAKFEDQYVHRRYMQLCALKRGYIKRLRHTTALHLRDQSSPVQPGVANRHDCRILQTGLP